MALYLAAAVVGVVVIVYLVLQLTKSSPNSAAGGPSTPSHGTTAPAAVPASGFVVTQAASVGPYPLNKAATTEYTAGALQQSAPIVAKIKTQGAGQPGKDVVGIYNLTPVTSIASRGVQGHGGRRV